jgi:hypothetical protein
VDIQQANSKSARKRRGAGFCDITSAVRHLHAMYGCRSRKGARRLRYRVSTEQTNTFISWCSLFNPSEHSVRLFTIHVIERLFIRRVHRVRWYRSLRYCRWCCERWIFNVSAPERPCNWYLASEASSVCNLYPISNPPLLLKDLQYSLLLPVRGKAGS